MIGRSIPDGLMCPLWPFPDLPHPDVEVVVEASRPQADVLRLWFTLRGDLSGIAIPGFGEPARADGLWQHTCGEAFLRTGNGPGYCEFNISPSRQWAAYRFTRYREGMETLDVRAPDIGTAAIDRHFAIGATIGFDPFWAEAPWRLGLAAVIEAKDGTKSYWALAHPDPEKPDFHHPDCFVLELPAA